MRTEHLVYDTVEKWIEADKEQNRTVMAMLDRRGRCERCGCTIEGIGLCDRCTEIVDMETKKQLLKEYEGICDRINDCSRCPLRYSMPGYPICKCQALMRDIREAKE